MAERTDPLPALLLRWLIPPAAFGALLTAVTALIRRTREPAMPRMSDEWLNTHVQDSSRHNDYE